MSRRSTFLIVATFALGAALAAPVAARVQAPQPSATPQRPQEPPANPASIPQPLESLKPATPPPETPEPAATPQVTETSLPGSPPAPGASGCVPDTVRFDAKYAVPAWVDPLHPTVAKPYLVNAPKATLRLAVATDVRQRARGLMCVTTIPLHAGMIFAFPNEQRLDFWMKDTLVPLDMIWVAANGVVTNVAAKVPATTPSTPDEAIPRRAGIGKFVIELASGDAARVGIVKGTKLVLPPVASQ
jgi:uncharacterized membrane protein (UPF0127 family)